MKLHYDGKVFKSIESLKKYCKYNPYILDVIPGQGYNKQGKVQDCAVLITKGETNIVLDESYK